MLVTGYESWINCRARVPSLADLGVDVSYVRQMLDTPDEPVVLVGHSYAGMVITEFADHPKVGTVPISRRPGHSAGSQC